MKNLIWVLVLGAVITPVAFAHAITTLNGVNATNEFLVATGTDVNLSIRITSVGLVGSTSAVQGRNWG